MYIHSCVVQVDTTVYAIHENLKNAAAAQTRVRLQEATSRSFVEALNERVTWGSLIHVVIILVVAVGQVYLLRSLFNSPSGVAAAVSSRNRIMPTVGYWCVFVISVTLVPCIIEILFFGSCELNVAVDYHSFIPIGHLQGQSGKDLWLIPSCLFPSFVQFVFRAFFTSRVHNPWTCWVI